MNTSSQGA